MKKILFTLTLTTFTIISVPTKLNSSILGTDFNIGSIGGKDFLGSILESGIDKVRGVLENIAQGSIGKVLESAGIKDPSGNLNIDSILHGSSLAISPIDLFDVNCKSTLSHKVPVVPVDVGCANINKKLSSLEDKLNNALKGSLNLFGVAKCRVQKTVDIAKTTASFCNKAQNTINGVIFDQLEMIQDQFRDKNTTKELDDDLSMAMTTGKVAGKEGEVNELFKELSLDLSPEARVARTLMLAGKKKGLEWEKWETYFFKTYTDYVQYVRVLADSVVRSKDNISSWDGVYDVGSTFDRAYLEQTASASVNAPKENSLEKDNEAIQEFNKKEKILDEYSSSKINFISLSIEQEKIHKTNIEHMKTAAKIHMMAMDDAKKLVDMNENIDRQMNLQKLQKELAKLMKTSYKDKQKNEDLSDLSSALQN
jgi:hypothetical protein